MTEPLKPCPFCGGDAEQDYCRSYRDISTGALGRAVAVYCTRCSADMTICCEEHRGTPRDDLMADLVCGWNSRASNAASS